MLSYLGRHSEQQAVTTKARSLDGRPPSLDHCRRFCLFPIQDRGYSLRRWHCTGRITSYIART
jgi:hypothetical protein